MFLGEGGDNNIDKAIQEIEKRAGEDEGFLSGDEDDWVKENGDEDGEGNVDDPDQYESDDDDGDDYNAEAYFDGNQDDEDYGDDGGDNGGDY